MHFYRILLFAAALGFSSACKQDNTNSGEFKQLEINKLNKATPEQIDELTARFIDAKEGDVIDIPAGFYEMPTQLILDNVSNVTIKGAGMYETVLSFKKLTTGGEGLKIAGNNVILENFTVMDAPGDCIKTQKCSDLTFRGINTTWTNQDKSKNGTYGIYPVQCKNVLVEKCEVSNSRDAGIYVGQSENIIVRDNYVHENVAGIEIENSDNAEVYNNRAENNTGGILIFNLPGLPKAFGSRTRVYKNLIKDNNHTNFAVESSSGNPVTMIPPGSGVVILAGDQVEITENKIIGHRTAAVSVVSYQVTGLPVPSHPGWSPYTTNIIVHNNTYERPLALPDLSKDLGKLIAAKALKAPDFIYDGITDPKRGTDASKNPMRIFVNEPKVSDFRFARLVIPDSGELMEIKLINDAANFKGSLEVKTDVSMVGKK